MKIASSIFLIFFLIVLIKTEYGFQYDKVREFKTLSECKDHRDSLKLAGLKAGCEEEI
jgi:hypothetical protein